MDKLSLDYQKNYLDHLIYDPSVFNNIDPSVKLHEETKGNPLSSAAACLNVIGSLANNPDALKNYLNLFGLNIEIIFEFPHGSDVGGQIYQDRGYAIFEWIGPKASPINEVGGGRGHIRTSIDAFVIAQIDGKTTQILIEWKFTEGKSWPLEMMKFSGMKGIERLRRYSTVLKEWRRTDFFPFNFKLKEGIGLYDFSVDHLYQLLRITLLAKSTLDIQIGRYKIKDYRIVHLSHSQNDQIDVLHEKYLMFSPGLQKYAGMKLYDVWKDILCQQEKTKFIGGHWDTSLHLIKDAGLREYLTKRY